MGGSLALAAATAVAFSGSLVIFSLCRAHLSHGAEPEPEPELEEGAPEHALRPCLASSGTYETRRSSSAAGPPQQRLFVFLLAADGILTALLLARCCMRREADARGEGEGEETQGREAGAVRGRRRRQ